MRETRFRAWHPVAEKMVYSESHLYGFWKFVSNNDLADGFNVMQYTGLKDKNGVEIYEGDIINTFSKYYPISTVSWDEEHTGFDPFCDANETDDFGTDYQDPSEVEVIGNIYENPELI